MAAASTTARWRSAQPGLPYIAPFAAILFFIALRPHSPLSPAVEWPMQTLVVAALSIICWPGELSKVPRYWLGSILIGTAVFLIWIGPDVLIPGYRHSILFANRWFGAPQSSIPPSAQKDWWVLSWRMARATIVIPIAEELFWRAWLMRWLVNNNFLSVRLGTYMPLAFFATAILFASEHGPYWDVGLIAGLVYNWWMIRTRSVADCIVMHAITNGLLSWYVVATGNWQYWM